MTDFEEIFTAFTKIDDKDRRGFMMAKIHSVSGYINALPQLEGIVSTIISRIIIADGVIDLNEIAFFDLIKTSYNKKGTDLQSLIKGLKQFSKTDEDMKMEIGAFKVLPEYIQIDLMFVFLALASLDGCIADEELKFLRKLM